MTSPTEYTRVKTQRARGRDRIWAALWAAPPEGATVAELAEAARTSRREVSRMLQRGRDAGWVEVLNYRVEPGERVTASRHRKPLYGLTPSAPHTVPVLAGAADDPAREAVADSGVSGARLRALRKRWGWTVRETAAAIGVTDPGTVRRYENLPSLPPRVAELVAQLDAAGA